jgi:hypothetical protein
VVVVVDDDDDDDDDGGCGGGGGGGHHRHRRGNKSLYTEVYWTKNPCNRKACFMSCAWHCLF